MANMAHAWCDSPGGRTGGDCIVLVVSMRAVVCQVCPVCAAYPGGEPNHVIDDLAAHLMLEHRTSNNDLISFVFARDSDSFRPD